MLVKRAIEILFLIYNRYFPTLITISVSIQQTIDSFI